MTPSCVRNPGFLGSVSSVQIVVDTDFLKCLVSTLS